MNKLLVLSFLLSIVPIIVNADEGNSTASVPETPMEIHPATGFFHDASISTNANRLLLGGVNLFAELKPIQWIGFDAGLERYNGVDTTDVFGTGQKVTYTNNYAGARIYPYMAKLKSYFAVGPFYSVGYKKGYSESLVKPSLFGGPAAQARNDYAGFYNGAGVRVEIRDHARVGGIVELSANCEPGLTSIDGYGSQYSTSSGSLKNSISTYTKYGWFYEVRAGLLF